VIVYVPTVAVFTEPVEAKEGVAPYAPVIVVPVPSALSAHEAPASVYDEFCVIDIFELPTRVTTGFVISILRGFVAILYLIFQALSVTFTQGYFPLSVCVLYVTYVPVQKSIVVNVSDTLHTVSFESP
jgi:hypothetical protein